MQVKRKFISIDSIYPKNRNFLPFAAMAAVMSVVIFGLITLGIVIGFLSIGLVIFTVFKTKLYRSKQFLNPFNEKESLKKNNERNEGRFLLYNSHKKKVISTNY